MSVKPPGNIDFQATKYDVEKLVPIRIKCFVIFSILLSLLSGKIEIQFWVWIVVSVLHLLYHMVHVT